MRPKNPEPAVQGPKSSLKRNAPALLLLAFAFVLFYKDWHQFNSKVFLSLDMSFLYYPLFNWVQQHLNQNRLPLISDMAYHGAPVAALALMGVLSPATWIFNHVPLVTDFNLWVVCPTAFYLFGAYALGREFQLTRSASLLLAFLYTFNGHQMAQLDHLNVSWAHAFFPYSFLSLLRSLKGRRFTWILLSSLFMALNLLSGHPQVVFLECLFFIFWAFLSPFHGTFSRRWANLSWMGLCALLFSSPLILHLAETLSVDGFHFQWGEADRFFHSWTPLNFITLFFPWFFGKYQYDRSNSDYWWQYQFTEMQVTFSIAGLFFILLFFFSRDGRRRWLGWTALFGVLMSFGKFFVIYPLLQTIPVFSFFRDPARYWFLANWALGAGAAWGWQSWFKDDYLYWLGRKLCFFLWTCLLGLLLTGWVMLKWGRPLLESSGAWVISHILMGDSLHSQPLSAYMSRLPEKLEAIAFNLDLRHSRVFFPFLFLAGLTATVWNRKSWNLKFQKAFLLSLVLLDLFVFRMPLGQSFFKPSDISPPKFFPPQNRSLVFIRGNPSPLPPQYGEMAFPNMNFSFNYPNLAMVVNPPLNRYAQISADLGWFSWVYKDRDPKGFTRNTNLMRILGLDQVVTDTPGDFSSPFELIRNSYPYVYRLPGVMPRAHIVDQYIVQTWPGSLSGLEKPGFKPSQDAVLESPISFTGKSSLKSKSPPIPKILKWDETQLSLNVTTDHPCLLILQKTFLPAWKAWINGKKTDPIRCDLVLTSIPLVSGENRVTLSYQPSGLRLGFFLLFIMCGWLIFHLFRLKLA